MRIDEDPPQFKVDDLRLRFRLCAKLSDGDHTSVVQDIDVACEMLREWAAERPHDSPGDIDRVWIESCWMSEAEVDALPDL
ncbi:MAG: hypothetical protein WC789_09540 [Lentisphaeria bacterium]